MQKFVTCYACTLHRSLNSPLYVWFTYLYWIAYLYWWINKCYSQYSLRGAPFNMLSLLFGHCPFGGGGLNACPNGLGQLFREVQTGICLILGGSKPLPRWFGALMQWKLKLKWAFACVKEGVKACQDALCTYVPSKWWFGKFAQIGLGKKCPGVPVWVRGGVQSLFGQCPNRSDIIFNGAPLKIPYDTRINGDC